MVTVPLDTPQLELPVPFATSVLSTYIFDTVAPAPLVAVTTTFVWFAPDSFRSNVAVDGVTAFRSFLPA